MRDIQDVNHPGPQLNAQALERISAIEGVEAAFPEMRFPAQIRLGGKEMFTLVQVLPASACRSGLIKLRSGACYDSDEPNELIISDSLLHRLDGRDPEAAPGTKIEVATLTLDFGLANLLRMAFSSGGQALPFARENHAFTVVGVAGRMGFMGPLPLQSDVLIPPGAAAKMRKLSLTSVWDLFAPSGGGANYSSVSVRVKSPQDVEAVTSRDRVPGLRDVRPDGPVARDAHRLSHHGHVPAGGRHDRHYGRLAGDRQHDGHVHPGAVPRDRHHEGGGGHGRRRAADLPVRVRRHRPARAACSAWASAGPWA